MKITAYYALHYGKEWLKYSMRSIVDYVDEICVFYAQSPSHGHNTTLSNPDSRQELYDIASTFDVVWYDCPGFMWEGNHRDYAVDKCINERDAGIVLVVDADEIWNPTYLEYALEFVEQKSYRHYRARFIHFWRSLHWVCYDQAMPVRFHRRTFQESDECYIIGPDSDSCVYHMGYAQSPEIIKYKQDIHGHKGEWRKGWFDNKFMPWVPGMNDVHPTCVDFWNPIEYRDDKALEYLVCDHPYWDLEIIR